MAATVNLDATHVVICSMLTMTQFYFLVSVIISSVTHELFRIMLLFPDLQGFWGIFVNDFSPVHTSEWFHLRGRRSLAEGYWGLLPALAEQLLPQAKRAAETDSRKLARAHNKRKVRGIWVGHQQPLLPRQVSSFISNALFHCFVLITSFLGTKDGTNNTLWHLTFAHLSWRDSNKRTQKAS